MKKSRKLSLLLRLLPLLLILSAASSLAAGPLPQTSQTVAEIAAEDGRFDTLVTALEAANLVETLNGEGPFTIFAPTDEAFEALPAGALDGLLADPEALETVLLYHVVADKVTATDVATLESTETVAGELVGITLDENVVLLNDTAQVIIADIEGANGVIHAIDTVLLPDSAAALSAEPLEAPAEEREEAEAIDEEETVEEVEEGEEEETPADEPAATGPETDAGEENSDNPGALPVTGTASLATGPNTTLLALSILGLMVVAGGMALYARKNK